MAKQRQSPPLAKGGQMKPSGLQPGESSGKSKSLPLAGMADESSSSVEEWTYQGGDFSGYTSLAPDEIRLAGPIQSDSIVDGPGLRTVVWCQGCYRHCPGCHNPESWDDHAGHVVKISWVIDQLSKLRGQTGITFSGGEPMLQAKACKQIADWARKEMHWNVLSFSGFTYEDIRDGKGLSTPDMWEFTKSLDMLVDGPFILSQRDISLKFRGSRNQRLLHLDHGKVVSIE